MVARIKQGDHATWAITPQVSMRKYMVAQIKQNDHATWAITPHASLRKDMAAQIKQGDHATWAITPHVFVGRKKGWDQILWKWYSTTSGPVALPQMGKKEGCYYCEVFPHSGCPPTKDLWSLSFSPTTDSDLAFGADPFGDRAASEDLPFFLLRAVPPLWT